MPSSGPAPFSLPDFDRLAFEADFVAKLKARWAAGAAEYGDRSFVLPLDATTDEILAEVEDIAGWSFVMWCNIKRRLRAVEAAVAAKEASTPPAADSCDGC